MADKHGVLLVNLGTPDSPGVADVRAYLREFLMDPRVIDIPYPARFLLVHGIIRHFVRRGRRRRIGVSGDRRGRRWRASVGRFAKNCGRGSERRWNSRCVTGIPRSRPRCNGCAIWGSIQ